MRTLRGDSNFRMISIDRLPDIKKTAVCCCLRGSRSLGTSLEPGFKDEYDTYDVGTIDEKKFQALTPQIDEGIYLEMILAILGSGFLLLSLGMLSLGHYFNKTSIFVLIVTELCVFFRGFAANGNYGI